MPTAPSPAFSVTFSAYVALHTMTRVSPDVFAFAKPCVIVPSGLSFEPVPPTAPAATNTAYLSATRHASVLGEPFSLHGTAPPPPSPPSTAPLPAPPPVPLAPPVPLPPPAPAPASPPVPGPAPPADPATPADPALPPVAAP